jgi:glycine/D-amino acid oxidase-like deaminating enzyme
VHTQQRTYQAKVVLRTTEAFSTSFSQDKRSVIPLYSMMVATEPLSSDVWSEIGLDRRPSFNDGRNMIIYGQRTIDNRLAFGGRGAPYHFGSKILPSFDFNQKVAHGLRSTLIELFPILDRTEFTHHWGGPLAAPRDWTFNVSFNPESGLGSAGGYVGDGVATSNLAGRILADMVCERSSEITRLSCVNHFSKKWEIEPLRYVAVNSLTKLAMLADRKEDKTGRPARIINGIIDKISGG